MVVILLKALRCSCHNDIYARTTPFGCYFRYSIYHWLGYRILDHILGGMLGAGFMALIVFLLMVWVGEMLKSFFYLVNKLTASLHLWPLTIVGSQLDNA